MRRRRYKRSNPLTNVIASVGGFLALGLAIFAFRELPAMRREFRIMRM